MRKRFFNYFKYKNTVIYLSFLFFPLPVFCTDGPSNPEKEPKEASPLNIGNFALPTPQQPGPLISFGQHVINKDQAQVFWFADDFKGEKKHKIDLIPTLLLGVTDDFSISFSAPLAVKYKDEKTHSSGCEDIFLQLEYAPYTAKTANFQEQLTLLTSITFPTGSTHKQPQTGFGSSSFFVGGTFSRMYTDWFGFTSHGVLLTTSDEGTKFGDEFLYQCGLGRNIFSIASELIISGMIEIDGQYVKKDKIKKITNPDSGGNILYVTPSLWISTKRVIFQVGFGLPATQHLFGNQKKNNYLLAANCGWTF
ncbi:MAG: hypothetical protein H0X26_01710 [Alphaproteobacteria bacterium]|nr:hypothetical protein [Alphaproteobacteria bacterium]